MQDLSNRCSDIIFEMNDALALRLDQTGTLNLDDDTINILYQKHILDSTIGVRVCIIACIAEKGKASSTRQNTYPFRH
jgi:hypothetical protein